MIDEIDDLLDVIPHIDHESFVFLDFDETIIATSHDFGSCAWENFLVNQQLDKGLPREHAIEKASWIWTAIQAVSKVELVQEEVNQLLTHLDAQGVAYKILTARSPEMGSITEKQLLEVRLDSLYKASFEQEMTPLSDKAGVKGAVIYCHDEPKGSVLTKYLALQNRSFKKIVMLDDRMCHLESIATSLPPELMFHGFRYNRMDHKLRGYTPDETTEIMHKLLLDPKATQFLMRALNLSK